MESTFDVHYIPETVHVNWKRIQCELEVNSMRIASVHIIIANWMRIAPLKAAVHSFYPSMMLQMKVN